MNITEYSKESFYFDINLAEPYYFISPLVHGLSSFKFLATLAVLVPSEGGVDLKPNQKLLG